MKRTALRPSRKGLRARSPRRDAYEAELDAATPALLARSGGRCEVVDGSRCERAATDRHHVVRRSQGGRNDLANLLHLCRGHHRAVHDMPEWAYASGFMRRGSD